MIKKLIGGIFLILASLLFFLLLSGCTTEKKLLRQKVKQDSSTITELQQQVKMTKQENTRLESELRQAQYSGVTFDSTPCPPVNPPAIYVDSRCNVDSVKSNLQAYYSSLWQNKVKVLANGTIEAQGRLKSAIYTNTLLQKIISERQSRIDSFSAALAKEKQNIKTVEVVKDKWKKTAFPWWWLAIAFIAGAVVWHRFGYQIKLFFKHFTTKWKT